MTTGSHTENRKPGDHANRSLVGRKETAMRNRQVIAQRDRAEEELVVWLKAKSMQELRQFLATAWVASLLSAEAIEEFYQQVQQQEAAWLDREEGYIVEEYLVEVGLD
jgi:hypothetical protein